MAVAEISIEPLGTGTPSVGDLIAECVNALKKEPNLKISVTAMGTIVEGDTHQILHAAERMDQACFAAGVKRVMLTIRLDDRRDKHMSMEEMESEVEQRTGLGRGPMPRILGSHG